MADPPQSTVSIALVLGRALRSCSPVRVVLRDAPELSAPVWVLRFDEEGGRATAVVLSDEPPGRSSGVHRRVPLERFARAESAADDTTRTAALRADGSASPSRPTQPPPSDATVRLPALKPSAR